MRKLLFILFSWVVTYGLPAQDNNPADIPALLENKVWKVQFPQDKQYAMEMEFRDAGWRSAFLYDGKRTETFYSYSLCDDTIKVFESRKNYIIQELTDSTLVFQYLPDTLTIGVGPVRCVTDNSLQGQRENENRLDSIWRAEIGWNLGLLDMSGKPIKDLSTIEPPRWAKWDYNLEKYYTSQMVYPEELLKKNQAGYSVVMFSIDTLGLPRGIHILTSKHKEFDKEVVRLTKELPHCLPCRDKNGKRMKCLYAVYVPFLPQHYRNRVKADSIAEEEQKHCFLEWEAAPSFQDGNYITQHLSVPFKRNKDLIAPTNEKHLEVGVPVCYLNEQGDTIVPYGKSDEWQLVDRDGTEKMEYTVIRKGITVKGLQITLFDKHGKTAQEISYTYPSDIEAANAFNVRIDLQDVNFDGKDDILVSLGQYGNQMTQYYDCLVWDDIKKEYRKEESFKQIENPRIDNEKRCVFSSSRISAASYSYKRFEFIGGHFVETAALT